MERLNSNIHRKYFENVCHGVTIVPYSIYTPITRKIELKGWPIPMTLTVEDKTLDEISQLCAKILKSFLDIYKFDYVFSEPMFYFNLTDNTAGIKIGMLEKEEYERRKSDQERL